MFAYCGNNPVNRIDSSGTFWDAVGSFFTKIGDALKSVFGAGRTVTATKLKTEAQIIPDPFPITLKTGYSVTEIVEKYGDSTKPISVYANLDAENPIKSSSVGLDLNLWGFSVSSGLALDNIYLSGSFTNGNQTDKLGIRINLSEFKVGIEGATSVQWDQTIETAYINCSANAWSVIAAYYLLTTGQLAPSPSPSPMYT